MKHNILKYCISILLLLCSSVVFSQDEHNDEEFIEAEVENDSIVVYHDKYGLRLGFDLSKPITRFIKLDLKELEISGDYRINKKMYLAAEIGTSTRVTEENYLNYTTKGAYIRLGVNRNMYKNWMGMSNEIYSGFRYGFSSFEQTLNSYTPNFTGSYFDETVVSPDLTFSSLNAHWIEFLFGMKVETLKNLYLGVGISVKKLIAQKKPENFSNLYIPGFNRVFLNNSGFGFHYTISYSIPLYKKIK